MKTIDDSDQGTRADGSPLREVLQSVDLRRVMPGLVISALLSNLLALALPLALLQIMSRIVIDKSLDTLMFLAGGIVVALILEEVLRSLNGLVTSWLGVRSEQSLSLSALDRLLRVPMKQYQRQEPGVYIEKVSSVDRVADYYSGHALLFLLDFPFVVIFLAVIGFIGGWLVLVPLALLIVFGLIMIHSEVRIRDQIRSRQVVDDRRFNFISEVLGNILSVKVLTTEALMQRRYEKLQESNAEQVENLINVNAAAMNLRVVFSQIMVVCVIYAGVWIVISGGMTPGALAACMLLALRSLQPLLNGLSAWLSHQSFLDARHRLDIVMDMPADDDRGKPVIPPPHECIELRNISLGYESALPIFSDLSLTVQAGQYIAIQGESGSGKTSLLSLMNGISKPDSGSVLVDGHLLSEYSADSIHREIALLPQAGAIIAGTMLENMTMFDNSLNQQAMALGDKLGLGSIVAGMKLGYQTPVGGSTGKTLPEGVAQIVTIIRALVHNPSVILFDEANITLDMVGDRLLREYLTSIKGKCTMVLVTHRPSLLALADKVYALSEGVLTEVERESATAVQAETSVEATFPDRPDHLAHIAAVLFRMLEEESDFSRCLVPLLHSLEWSGQPRELAEAIPHLVQRLDISGLCSIMSNLGYALSHSSSDLTGIDRHLLPCLFVPENSTAMVILEKLPDGRLRVFDSERNIQTESEAFAISGQLYLFRRPDQAAVATRTENGWFGTLFFGVRRHLALAFALSVIITLLSLAPPLFVMSIYDWVLPAGDVVMGGYLLLGVAIAILISWSLRNLKGGIMAYLGARQEYILGASMFQRVVGLPISLTECVSVSRQVGRMKSLEGLRELFLEPLVTLAFDIPAILIMMVAIGFIAPPLLGIVAISIFLYGLLALATKDISKNAVALSSHVSSLRSDVLSEALIHMRAIRLAGATRLWLDRYKNLNAMAILEKFRNQQTQSRIYSVTKVIGASTGLCILAGAAVHAIWSGLSGGAILAAMMIVWGITGPAQNIFLSATSILRIRNMMKQVESLVALKTEREGGVAQTIQPELRGEIEFAGVTFRYANDAEPALQGVSLKVAPGQMALITGANGAGKSTLLKLLERMYAPQAGTVRMDGVDIRQLNMADHRTRISYMPQNVEIFYGSVTQNLLLADPSATVEELHWAIEMAGLAKDMDMLPDGLDTRISNSRSEMLPHGFRQKLSLARTILRPASVVLLDEPGTGMDQAGEEALLRCLAYLRNRGSTVLIVSHRPSHMRLADTGIYMERGTVVEMGDCDRIMNRVMAMLQS